MQSYNALLNQYDCDHDGEDTPVLPPVVQQINVQRPFVFNLDTATRVRQVLAYIGVVDESLQEAVLRLIAAENSIGAVDESLQEAVLRLTTAEVSITDLQDVDDLQNAQLAVLNDGELVSGRAFSTGVNGGAILAIKQNGESTVDAEGNPATVPASLELATYDAADTVEASMLLQGNLVTIAANLRVTGDLLLGNSENTVQAQLDDLEERILQEVIALASNYALDAAQQALIAGLALLLKPKGYEALPDLPDDEDFPDSNSIPPIRLFPAGKFTDALPDELGGVVERINSKGKITVSADVLPTRTMTVGGDVLFLQEDADDEFECQYTCRLGSQVAVLDAQQQLTNPDAVAVRLGTNALVTAAGAVNAESLTVDGVTTGKVNGLNTSRLVQRYAPTADAQLNRRVAQQANRTTAAVRRAIKPVLSRSYDDHVARLHAELLEVKRAAYSKTLAISKSYDEDVARLHAELLAVKRSYARPVLTKSYDDDIARIHADSLALKRGAYTKSVLTKSYDQVVARLSTDTLALKRGGFAKTSIPVRDSTRALGAVRDAVAAVKAYTAPISTSTAAALRVVGTLSATGKVSLAVSSGSSLTMGTTTVSNPIEWNVNASALALPAASLAGTRLRLHGSGVSNAANDYAIGMASSGMWYNVNLNAKHMFTSAGVQLAEIATAGSIFSTPVSVSGALTVVGNRQTTLGGPLTVNGSSSLAAVNASDTTTNNLTVNNSATVGSLAVQGDLQVGGTMTVPSLIVGSTVVTDPRKYIKPSIAATTLLNRLATTRVDPRKYIKPSIAATALTNRLARTRVDARKYVKPVLSKDASSVAAALFKRSVHVDTVTTYFSTDISNNYEAWFIVGTFVDSFTGKIVVTCDSTDTTLCDALSIDFCYNRSGLAPVITMNKSGNTNVNPYKTLSGVSLSDYALNGAGQIHTLLVGFGSRPYLKTFTATVTVDAGNFTLNKPLTFTQPNTSVGVVGPRYDPTYSFVRCEASGTNNGAVSNFQSGVVNMNNVIINRAQVKQLCGVVQSFSNIPPNSFITLGRFRNQFSGNVRFVLTGLGTSSANTYQVTNLAINWNSGQTTSSVVVTTNPASFIQGTPTNGVLSAYINSTGYLILKGSATNTNLYWTAINSDPFTDLYGDDPIDGWDETAAVIGGAAGGQTINISNVSMTSIVNDLEVVGNLTNTSGNASLCARNTGNYVEFVAGLGGASTYIDLHSGPDTANIDYNGRIIQTGNDMGIGALGKLSLSGADGVSIQQPLNCGQTYGQVINLTNDKQWGIGLQDNGTGYFRAPSNFAFYKAGVHSNTANDPGAGGVLQAVIGSDGNMYLRGANGTNTSVVRSTKNVLRSGVQGAGSQSSGFISYGQTFNSTPVVTANIDDAGGTIASLYINGISTSGFSWNASNSGGASRSIKWMAHGDAF
jgi:hypothetical protein